MKKINLILLLILPLLFSFTTSNYNQAIIKENTFNKNSDEEFLKRIINQIEAAEKAVEYLDQTNKNQKYSAIVIVNRNMNDKFGNSIVISLNEEDESTFSGSCKICNVSTISSCLSKINKIKPLSDEFVIKVKIENGDLKLLW